MATKRPRPRFSGIAPTTPRVGAVLRLSFALLVVLLPFFWIGDALPGEVLVGLLWIVAGAALAVALVAAYEGYRWLLTR